MKYQNLKKKPLTNLAIRTKDTHAHLKKMFNKHAFENLKI